VLETGKTPRAVTPSEANPVDPRTAEARAHLRPVY